MNRVLYFSTKTCRPCATFKPVAQEVCSTLGLPLQFIDANDSPTMAAQYGVSTVPTLIVLDSNDTVLKRQTGAIPKSYLQTMISPYAS
jgi:thioredoxin-like negative regulator of GroEL